ncbi:hypothetical protein AVEN_221045-1 [Araneus ventricosus]|uniref:Uncharacterized protein n=1 Tax=Araneus ventricosus TaxID=182803 RepID=A0A4Y2UP03_ARAVE|nr:hypothetical protein AVEN_29599-1 [Araneus ventricosus]GBO14727.1 hypothetical protein AVEN_221045-1 [Araneus ventricosus]
MAVLKNVMLVSVYGTLMPVDDLPSDGSQQKCERTINDSNEPHICWFPVLPSRAGLLNTQTRQLPRGPATLVGPVATIFFADPSNHCQPWSNNSSDP